MPYLSFVTVLRYITITLRPSAANITILDSTYVMDVNGVVANASVTVSQDSDEGEVLFNITAFDLAGNNFTADQTQLNSPNVIIDTESLILENLTIYSNNANASLATVNNILNITITVDEALKSANITILGSTHVMSVNGTVANASVNVDQTSAEGEVLFNITAFDLAGNSFTVDQTQLNSLNVIIDTSSPTLDNLTIYSNNANPSLATVNNILNITITVNETLKAANITILDSTYVMDVNGVVANASVTVSQDSDEGEVSFNITAFDLAGNSFTVDQTQLNSSNVIIDTSSPTLDNLTIYSNNANPSLATVNNILNITITANETLKAANITILGSTYVMNVSGAVANANVTVDQNSAEGEVSFNITAFDLAGNSFIADHTQLNSSNVTIDHSIPGVENLNVTSNNSNPKVAMAGDAITVTLQVSEQIGNSTLQILNNDIVMTINDDTASATITVLENSTNGPVEFNITAYDKTGNIFTVTQDNYIIDDNVVIDTNGPSIVNLTISSNNANTSLATVNNILNITITANETLKAANITILDSTYVMNVSGAVANANVTVDQNSAEGEVLFNITAFDLAGNNFTADQTQLNSSNVTIDTSSPMLDTLTVYSDRPNMSLARIGNNVAITLDVTESLQNAIIEILNNTVNMTVMDDIAYASVTVTNYSANGPVEFNITAYDKTGNIFTVTQEDIAGDNVEIDTIDPSLVNLTISSNNTNPSFAKVNDIVTITLNTTEPIGSMSVTALNQTINANINGAIATASILVDQNATNGLIEFSINISDTNDVYMNTFNQYQLETDNVFVDTMPPVIKLIHHRTNSVNDSDGNVGDWIEINNTYNDPGSSVQDNDPTYHGSASTTSDVTESAVGIYHVRYDATDNAGNIAQSVYRTVSVLHLNGSADVELPLSHTNPVIYSNNTQLDASKWNKDGHSITFQHHYTQIIQNVIVIKIENTTIVSTADTTISRDSFSTIPILGYLNDNNVSGVSIGHADIVMIFYQTHYSGIFNFYYYHVLYYLGIMMLKCYRVTIFVPF